MLNGKRILLIIGGGIAAVKIPDLIRKLKAEGAEIVPVMTPSAGAFVTPLAISALAKHIVHQELFDLDTEAEMGHIALSRSADLILVAPATADLMGRVATGRADDLAACLLLATYTPVIMVPAMNLQMWAHPATQRNLSTLKHDGVRFIGPIEGDMACGEFGIGRMADIESIVEGVRGAFEGGGGLKGRKVIVTSGPTREPLDPVRYLSNHSSGRQGGALAQALLAEGAEVCFITGPVQELPPLGAEIIAVQSACEMLCATQKALPADVAIFVAAVADWRAASPSRDKIKKNGSKAPELRLVENPDILATISKLKKDRPALVIGFAAETENLKANGRAKLDAKGCDWIVANDVSPGRAVIGGQSNEIVLLRGASEEVWPRLSKQETANRLVAEIIKAFQ